MEISKQNIVQCITCAANNLRLSSEKIEVVAILKEQISQTEDMSKLILDMKKLTRFSKFAIKLGEVNQFIANGKIDFMKISDKFKEHTHLILRELSNLLDILTPQECLEGLKGSQKNVEPDKPEQEIDHSKLFAAVRTDEVQASIQPKKKSESDLLKEEIILGDLKEENEATFENFEKEVLRPIKELDAFLGKLSKNVHNPDDLIFFAELMNNNAELSEKIGFEVITNMHNIFSAALTQIREQKIKPDPVLVEQLRACLIVIAAVVRGKEVDITSYLNDAESLGKKVKIIN